jgi:hypothetical protein
LVSAIRDHKKRRRIAMSDNLEDDDLDNEEEVLDEEEEDLDKEDLELAEEFQKLVTSITAKIDKHLKAASKELNKAIKLSEKHGVPFHSNISFLGQSYTPSTFSSSKFADLDRETISDITDVWDEYMMDGGGWQHSAVC